MTQHTRSGSAPCPAAPRNSLRTLESPPFDQTTGMRVTDGNVMGNGSTHRNGLTRSSVVGLLGSLACMSSIACNSLDAPPREGAGFVRVAPTDSRAVVSSETPAAPVMGSNLLSLQTSPETVVLTDADRNRVSFVNTSSGNQLHVDTGAGSVPNRAVEDAAGFVHVALRGTGEVAMLHPSGELVARHKICQAPRGLDFDAVNNQLLVACAEGGLVRHSVQPTDYQTIRVIPTDVDVRDVVVLGERTYVSRMRSAQVLEFQGDEFVARHDLPTVEMDNSMIPTERAGSRFQPTVAWKMVAAPDNGGVVVLHQRSLLNVVGDSPTSGDDGAPSDSESGSSYGGSDPQMGCSAIVQPAVSEVRTDGSVVTSDSIAGVVLAVDIVPQASFSPSDRTIVLAGAGTPDPQAPRATVVRLAGSDGNEAEAAVAPSPAPQTGVFSGTVRLHATGETNPRTGDVLVGCTSVSSSFSNDGTSGPTVSVTNTVNGEVFAYQRDSNRVLRGDAGFFTASPAVILDGESSVDTGHELFHRDSGGGIACASCHPEGEDDGHVWNFASSGERKTQFLGVPLDETAPFHWDGSLPNMGVLMDEVFVARMGGVFQTDERVGSLGAWVRSAEPAIAASATDLTTTAEAEEAAARGKELFESKEVGCATCHSGPAFTDNVSYAVGTSGEERLQTPSLARVALHPPFMHDGCAKTLRERFEPACGGGDLHGKTSQLEASQLDDLVAYLATL